jgi:hypothetical protein
MADALNDLSLVPQTSPDKNYFNLTIKLKSVFALSANSVD